MNKDDLPEVRIPLYRVGEWIATEGGARDLGPSSITFENKNVPDYRFSSRSSPVHARAWDKALPQLLNAIHTSRLRVEGLRDGDDSRAFKRIKPREFPDVAEDPFGQTSLQMIFSNRRRLRLYPDDTTTISDGRRDYWSNIRACSRDEVLSLWPAATVKASSSYISLPEALEKFGNAERQLDCEGPAAVDALLEKFRDAIALPLSKATYCETDGRLKVLAFEDWFETCQPSLLKADCSALPMVVLFERDAFDDLDIVRGWQRVASSSPMTDDDLREWLQTKEHKLAGRPPIRTWGDNQQFFQNHGVTKPRFEDVWREMYPNARAGRPSKNVPQNVPRVSRAKGPIGNLAK
ncbi:MAG: hypothetical protein ACR65T_13200 [Methylocystis sp.]|uniref:hypothetical protein n=1 Tax=Methylocystis sp. TaxID=1911079 RepID=UPI003DA3F942